MVWLLREGSDSTSHEAPAGQSTRQVRDKKTTHPVQLSEVAAAAAEKKRRANPRHDRIILSPLIHRAAQPPLHPLVLFFSSTTCLSPQPRLFSSSSYGCVLFSLAEVAGDRHESKQDFEHGMLWERRALKDAQVALLAGQGLTCALGVDEADRHEASSLSQ
jgi:hypothetical protein